MIHAGGLFVVVLCFKVAEMLSGLRPALLYPPALLVLVGSFIKSGILRYRKVQCL
jgi:hypothetical protein